MEKIVIKVNGMSCSHCERAVTNALKDLDGVKTVKVSLTDKNATVEYDSSKVSADTLKSTIEEAGYEVK